MVRDHDPPFAPAHVPSPVRCSAAIEDQSFQFEMEYPHSDEEVLQTLAAGSAEGNVRVSVEKETTVRTETSTRYQARPSSAGRADWRFAGCDVRACRWWRGTS